ncbi:hypothetical protein MIR68_009464 [Amoeboaphelidium protococcarum]|nr:hypothetical protein MIR68_009464 [Amoeboaphelidium protococcarum]
MSEQGNIKQKNPVTTEQRIIAGSFGGFCSVLATHPLDTLRVRMQAGQSIKAMSLRSLYSGLLPPVIGVLPVGALSFLGYDMGIRLSDQLQTGNRTTDLIRRYSLCGTFSALLAAAIIIPGERVKILLQNSPAPSQSLKSPIQSPLPGQRSNNQSVFYWIGHIYQTGGLAGLYSGTTITLMRDIPAYFIWFASYELSKQYFQSWLQDDKSLSAVLMAGSVAGVTQWSLCMPLDTIKTRIQTDTSASARRHSLIQSFTDLYRQQGLKGFYRGYLPAVIRAIPSNAISWLGTEIALSYLRK